MVLLILLVEILNVNQSISLNLSLIPKTELKIKIDWKEKNNEIQNKFSWSIENAKIIPIPKIIKLSAKKMNNYLYLIYQKLLMTLKQVKKISQ